MLSDDEILLSYNSCLETLYMILCFITESYLDWGDFFWNSPLIVVKDDYVIDD
jgi:hypothetical protein